MRRVLAGILLLSACAGPRGESFGYAPPERTPYDHRPPLKEQYLKAHRAAWNSQVAGFAEEWLGGAAAAAVTCCEATPNVTRGWYQGVEDGRRFTDRIRATTDRPEDLAGRIRRLKKEIEDRPVEDWYVSDAYTPSLLVEVAEPGGAVVRVYRDDTRTKLHEIRQVREGRNHGRCESYDVNGSLRSVETWVDGVRHGEQVSYSDTGEVRGRSTYRDGQPHGLELWFGDDGALSHYWEYETGLRHGRQVDWGPDGKLERYFRWRSGQNHGRCLSYQAEGAWVEVYDAGDKVGSTSRLLPLEDLPEEERPSTLQRLRDRIRR